MNNNILRRASCNAEIGQWWVPLDKKDTKKLGDVKLLGAASTKFLAGLEYLVKICTVDYGDDYTNKWIDASRKFVTVITLLESKKELNQVTIYNFQLSADECCDVYCGLTGRNGMTNYFYIIHCGHFSYFLEKYKNLYLLSQ